MKFIIFGLFIGIVIIISGHRAQAKHPSHDIKPEQCDTANGDITCPSSAPFCAHRDGGYWLKGAGYCQKTKPNYTNRSAVQITEGLVSFRKWLVGAHELIKNTCDSDESCGSNGKCITLRDGNSMCIQNTMAPQTSATPKPAEAEINRLSPCNKNTSEKTNRAAYCTCDYGDDQDGVDAYNKCKKDGTSKNKEDCKTAELLKKIEDLEALLITGDDSPKCFDVHFLYKTEKICYGTISIAASCAGNGGDSFNPFPEVDISCSDEHFKHLIELENLFKKSDEANACVKKRTEESNKKCCADNAISCRVVSSNKCEAPYVKKCSNSNDRSL